MKKLIVILSLIIVGFGQVFALTREELEADYNNCNNSLKMLCSREEDRLCRNIELNVMNWCELSEKFSKKTITKKEYWDLISEFHEFMLDDSEHKKARNFIGEIYSMYLKRYRMLYGLKRNK